MNAPLDYAPGARIVVAPVNNLFAWRQAEPYLRRALEHTDEWNIDDVAAQYCAGAVGIILCTREDSTVFGALCVETIDYPRKRILQVHLFGADDHTEDLWMPFIWPQLQEFAKNTGCASIMGTGRDGWIRKLKAKHRYLWEVPV